MNAHEEGRRRRLAQPNDATPVQESAWASDLITLHAANDQRLYCGVQLEAGAAAVVMVCAGTTAPTAVLGYKLDNVNGPTYWDTVNTGIIRVFKVF